MLRGFTEFWLNQHKKNTCQRPNPKVRYCVGMWVFVAKSGKMWIDFTFEKIIEKIFG